MEGGAYGAGKAGGAFDPHTLVRQPHTILRVVSWVRTGRTGRVGVWARTERLDVPRLHRAQQRRGRRRELPSRQSRCPPLPASLGPGEGRPLPDPPISPGSLPFVRPAPMAVTSRPRLCSWRHELHETVGQSPSSGCLLGGRIRAWSISLGCMSRLRWIFEEGQGTW